MVGDCADERGGNKRKEDVCWSETAGGPSCTNKSKSYVNQGPVETRSGIEERREERHLARVAAIHGARGRDRYRLERRLRSRQNRECIPASSAYLDIDLYASEVM